VAAAAETVISSLRKAADAMKSQRGPKVPAAAAEEEPAAESARPDAAGGTEGDIDAAAGPTAASGSDGNRPCSGDAQPGSSSGSRPSSSSGRLSTAGQHLAVAATSVMTSVRKAADAIKSPRGHRASEAEARGKAEAAGPEAPAGAIAEPADSGAAAARGKGRKVLKRGGSGRQPAAARAQSGGAAAAGLQRVTLAGALAAARAAVQSHKRDKLKAHPLQEEHPSDPSDSSAHASLAGAEPEAAEAASAAAAEAPPAPEEAAAPESAANGSSSGSGEPEDGNRPAQEDSGAGAGGSGSSPGEAWRAPSLKPLRAVWQQRAAEADEAARASPPAPGQPSRLDLRRPKEIRAHALQISEGGSPLSALQIRGRALTGTIRLVPVAPGSPGPVCRTGSSDAPGRGRGRRVGPFGRHGDASSLVPQWSPRATSPIRVRRGHKSVRFGKYAEQVRPGCWQ
jgi:hypothetical protein